MESFDETRFDAVLTLDAGGASGQPDEADDAPLGFDDVVIAVEIHLPLTPGLQALIAHDAERRRGGGPGRA